MHKLSNRDIRQNVQIERVRTLTGIAAMANTSGERLLSKPILLREERWFEHLNTLYQRESSSCRFPRSELGTGT